MGSAQGMASGSFVGVPCPIYLHGKPCPAFGARDVHPQICSPWAAAEDCPAPLGPKYLYIWELWRLENFVCGEHFKASS